jgi:hypothetical protein
MLNRQALAILIFLALVLSVSALSGCALPAKSLTVLPSSALSSSAPVASEMNTDMSFEMAIQEIQDASTLVISGMSKPVLTIAAADPRMSSIQKYLSEAVLRVTTLKTRMMVENGVTSTVSVAIPYVWGYLLTFELNDGSQIRFNCSDSIWFETNAAIYQASSSDDFSVYLNELTGQSIPSTS